MILDYHANTVYFSRLIREIDEYRPAHEKITEAMICCAGITIRHLVHLDKLHLTKLHVLSVA
jgi:hypothetical protein